MKPPGAKRPCSRAARAVLAGMRKGLDGMDRLFARGLPRLRQAMEGRPGERTGIKSLRLRLSLFFSLFLAAAWLTAAVFAWKECREYIDEFFDTQQMLFAKQLATADFSDAVTSLPRNKQVMPGVKKKSLGNQEDEALGFAVFTREGERILTDGEKGGRFPFEARAKGFSNVRLTGKKDVWRIVRLNSTDGRHVIAVGQELEYRHDMAFDLLGKQIMPWLLLLPVLLIGLFMLLSRELAPLHAIADELRARNPESTAPLDVSKAPSEVLPMVDALNGFFSRTNAMLARERSFISDAAHELRTPLTGLRIQAQVAARRETPPAARQEALGFLRQGIDRCARLVDQLLVLSRLEALRDPDAGPEYRPAGLSSGPVAWAAVLEEFMEEYRPRAEARGITISSRVVSFDAATQGYPALASMMLRNLFENALNYTPEHGHIQVTLEHDRLVVRNTCADLPDEYASRLGERFFRPPGQEEPGSGLGLSIVKRIAELHRFTVAIRTLRSTPETPGSFEASVVWSGDESRRPA